MDAFKIFLGKSGLKESYQENFTATTKCNWCGGEARIAFVAKEEGPGPGKRPKYVSDLHKNDPDGEGFWLHDACSVAVYFCRKCGEASALGNQA